MRPPFFKTNKDLQDKIDKYFEEETYCKPLLDKEGNPCTNRQGKILYDIKPPTVSGLAYYLGFSDRASLYDYKAKPEFTHTVKRATLLIERYAEEQLTQGNPSGAIFWLKNHRWTDKTEIENTGDVLTTINIRGLSSKETKED